MDFILVGASREQCKERRAVCKGKGLENPGQNFPGEQMHIHIY